MLDDIYQEHANTGFFIWNIEIRSVGTSRECNWHLEWKECIRITKKIRNAQELISSQAKC